MIPSIALMVGAYVFTRMLDVFHRQGERAPRSVRVFALITMVFTVIGTIDVLLLGTTGLGLKDLL